MELVRQEKIKINTYPKDPQKVDRRGFYIRVYYGQKQRLNKKTKKPLYDNDRKPLFTSDKEEHYFSDYTFYPDPKNDLQRRQNKHIKGLVEQEAEKWRVIVNIGKWKRGALDSSKLYLMDYMINSWVTKQNYGKSTLDGYQSIYKHFMEFKGRDLLISQLDRKTCQDFYNHLQTTVSHNGNPLSESAYKKYMRGFKYYLEQIFNGNVADGNSPAKGIRVGVAKPKSTKVFLEKQELEKFERLETHLKSIQHAYLFASYSAITKAELKNLKWGDFSLNEEKDEWFVSIVREKIKTPARLYVNKKAMSFILPKGNPHELVFKNRFWSYNDLQLKGLMLDAGINKQPITFHTSKNNYASMFYFKNEGRYLGDLMKALQHKDLSTTQRYLAGLLGNEMNTGANLEL